MASPPDPTPRNRLSEATSPYLLQHKDNPVHWYEWGDEALGRARDEDRPILLSIGYSACHWCHVMAHESFEDEGIAAVMNAHFVNVKVDREERPDLDDVYMAATIAMNHGQGGWPMTVFLTPGGEPFFAGTYFPPEDRWGRPGFRSILERVAKMWREERSTLVEQGHRLAEHLRENASAAPGTGLGVETLRQALAQYADDFDERWGGFGGAPKFPPATGLMLLLRCHLRFGDAHALEMVNRTLAAMAAGGMYDQIGGGFSRYSTDARWLVPHFEKMLYDNALLARAYLEAWQVTGDPEQRRIVVETLDYALREMCSPEGGFYSATDADSEGEEGRFFVWSPDQVREVLGDEAARTFCEYYDVTEHGNWEGRSIPNVPRSLEIVARLLKREPDGLRAELETSRRKVYEARLKRVPPGLDDKLLTAWNGLMIGALAEAGRVLSEPRYLEGARRAAGFVLERLRRPDGRLLRSWRAGRARLDAYLEDYAYLGEALVDLYEASGEERWLRESEAVAARIVDEFGSDAGGFYSTSRDHEALVVRHRDGHDGAIPNANATAAHVLARLSYHLGRDAWREEAVRALQAWGKPLRRQPRAFAKALIALDLLLDGPVELAFVGRAGSEPLEALRRAAAAVYLPRRIIGHHDPETGPSPLPLLHDKGLVDGAPALYVCRDFTCSAPVTRAADVRGGLAGAPPRGGDETLGLRRLAGRATPDATRAAASRLGERAATPLGSTGLTCSRIGFGGYRIDDDTPDHREALTAALLAGCNLVDTSTNYTDGGSERLVGEVLANLERSGRLSREGVVVVSKVGYVQGRNLERAVEREREGRPFPEVVKYADGLWHCLHPEFLEDQLERSLERLRLETLDVLLLHNPEYFLMEGARRALGTLDERRREFGRRIEAAFAWLESAVAAGRIQCYGVSSNTCTAPADDPEATSLTRMLEAARRVGGDAHHFRVLQLPMNLKEVGGVLEHNSGPDLSESVVQHAAAHGVGVLVNRPLNAMSGAGLRRLADVAVPELAAPPSDVDALCDEAVTLEAEFRERLAIHLQVGEGSAPPEEFFTLGRDLRALAPRLSGLEHWEQIERGAVLPRLVSALRSLDGSIHGSLEPVWKDWRERYVPRMQALLDALRARAAARSREALEPLSQALNEHLPPERAAESLSRRAIWVLTSTPGVSCVLVGMRTRRYVEDALGVLGWEDLPDAAGVLGALREA